MKKEKEMEKTQEKLFVCRKTYVKGGNEFYSYYVECTIRGKVVNISMKPMDINGYTLFDIVFGDSDSVELISKKEVFENDKKENIEYLSYEITSTDPVTKEVYSGKIKPSKSSDKQLLDLLFKQLK
jgi:hypothetical protein